MNKLLISRILRCLDENIVLVFYCMHRCGYIFYILGTSNFIYKIVINKKYQSCNCEDFIKNKILCKHICFVLFKLLKVYKISLNTLKINLRDNNSIVETNFFNGYIFSNKEWFIFKNRVSNINSYLKSKIFDVKYYNEFKYYYQQYIFLIYKNLEYTDENCTICLNKINKGITCPTCKKTTHIKCLNRWFNKIEIKKCPTCRSDYWNICYKYFILADNVKIHKTLIFNH